MNRENSVHDNLIRIKENILNTKLLEGLNQNVTIVAVTKTHPPETINEALKSGVVHVGENRVQEAESKFKNIVYSGTMIKHMIGHLQSNKIKKALDVFDRIDSIDTVSLAKKINEKMKRRKNKISTLLEVNTSRETNKFGFNAEHIDEMLLCANLENIHVEGLMTVGPIGGKEKETRAAFSLLRNIYEKMNIDLEVSKKLHTLSMGMSGDYLLGIKEGSTMVRIGTGLFGKRRIN